MLDVIRSIIWPIPDVKAFHCGNESPREGRATGLCHERKLQIQLFASDFQIETLIERPWKRDTNFIVGKENTCFIACPEMGYATDELGELWSVKRDLTRSGMYIPEGETRMGVLGKVNRTKGTVLPLYYRVHIQILVWLS